MVRRTKATNTDTPASHSLPSCHPSQEIVDDLAVSSVPPVTATDSDPVNREAQPAAERSRTPDPHPYAQINLGEGQHMRMWRNSRMAELAVAFSDKPEPGTVLGVGAAALARVGSFVESAGSRLRAKWSSK